MYNPCYDRVLAFIHSQGVDRAGHWFTAGDCARAANVSIPTARKHLINAASQWPNLIDLKHEPYRPNVSVLLFAVKSIAQGKG